MALIVCPHCGNQVSENANMCPNCGNNPHHKPRKKWNKKDYIILFSVITAVIAVVVLLFFVLRPDPYLKKGRIFMAEYLPEKFEELNVHLNIDINDFIEKEWDRKSCVKHFNVPLENDPVYSICAYQFCGLSKNDIGSMDDATAFFLTLLGSKTIFVVFRNGVPMNTRDRDGLADEMNSKICVVKKDGTSFPLDFHDCLELEYIDISYSNPHEVAKRVGEYVEQKYGSYEVICSCNSVNQMTEEPAEDNSEESTEAEEPVESNYKDRNTINIINGFEYNAMLLDYDGDYTNIRNAPSGKVVDKLYGYKGESVYYMYLSYNDGEWWRIRDNKVYDKSNGRVRYLKGSQCWIHSSCFSRDFNNKK